MLFVLFTLVIITQHYWELVVNVCVCREQAMSQPWAAGLGGHTFHKCLLCPLYQG